MKSVGIFLVAWLASCAVEPVDPTEPETGEVRQAVKHQSLVLQSQQDDLGKSFLQGATACQGLTCNPNPASWAVYTLWNNPNPSADLNNYWHFPNGNYWSGNWGKVFKDDPKCHFRSPDLPVILSVTRVWYIVRYATGASHFSPNLYLVFWPPGSANASGISGVTLPANTSVGTYNFQTPTDMAGHPLTPAMMGCDQTDSPRFGLQVVPQDLNIISIKIQVDYDTNI